MVIFFCFDIARSFIFQIFLAMINVVSCQESTPPPPHRPELRHNSSNMQWYCAVDVRVDFNFRKSGVRIPFLQDSDPGHSTSNEGRFLKFYWMNILGNFKIILFCFHTFGVRCPRSLKPSRIQGSKAYSGRLTLKVSKQKRRVLKPSKIFMP